MNDRNVHHERARACGRTAELQSKAEAHELEHRRLVEIPRREEQAAEREHQRLARRHRDRMARQYRRR